MKSAQQKKKRIIKKKKKRTNNEYKIINYYRVRIIYNKIICDYSVLQRIRYDRQNIVN